MARLDAIDHRLIGLLQQNGRMSMADLARQVGRSESTVRERLASLHGGGVLVGYRAVVDEKAVGCGVRAFLRGRCPLRGLPDVKARLESIPQVRGVAYTGAELPVLVEVQTADVEGLVALARTAMQAGLQDVEVEPVLRTMLANRPVPQSVHAAAEPRRRRRSPAARRLEHRLVT